MQTREHFPSKNSAVNNLPPAGAAEHFSSKNSAANGVPPAGAQVPVDTDRASSQTPEREAGAVPARIGELTSTRCSPMAARPRRRVELVAMTRPADLPILDSQSERH